MKKEDKKNIANIMALTPVQQGMLFHYLKEPAGELYFEQLTLELSGKVEKKLFEKAWNTVIQTNEMLRTVFRWEKIKNPLGVVLKQHTIKPRYYDSQDGNSIVYPTPLEEIKTKDRKDGFDLREVPFRITLYKHETNRHTLIISNHHILYDGWSNGILLNEFFSAYDMMSKGDVPQPITKTPFKDFIKWHRDRDQNKNKEFWKNYLSGIDAQSELSIKRKTNKEGITVTGTYNTGIEDALTTKTHGLAEKYKLTPAAILYTTWGLLVQRYNNNEDAIFGTTVSGRNAGVKGIEDMVGLFINTIPLRVKTESPSGVTGSNHKNHKKIELLQQVDEALRQRQEYDGTSLVKIKEYSDLNSSEELFDIIVVIDNYPLDKQLAQKESALAVTSYSMTEMTHYDLTVGITLFEGMELSISYDKKRFEKERIARLTRHFKNILQDVVTHPLQPLSTVKMMSAQELKQLIYDFNNTNADYPRDKTIHELFEEQVEKTPDSISTVGNEKIKAKSKKEIKDNKKIKEDKELTTREKTSSIQHPVSSIPSFPSTPSTLSTQLTYRELNKKANHLANQLHDKGFTPGAIAGMAKSSSVETIIAILAIWKAGGSYLPIDLTLPVERVKYMLADANAKILLCEPHDAYSPGIEVLSPGRMPTAAPALRALPPGSSLNAYIIYTSGTTGKPKGVMVPHSAFVNRLYWLQSRYAFGSSDVIIQKTPITFDVSLCELLRWIPGGGRLVIMEQGGEKEPAAMVEVIVKNRATTIDFIPSMLNHFLDYVENNNHQPGLSGLRWVFTGVEPISQELLRRFNRLLNKPFGTRLINAYGPTEATVDITYFDCSDDISGEMVPIGRPIQNTQIYILDKQGRTQPLAVPGELCIAGESLAGGYLNRPELTAERFAKDSWQLAVGSWQKEKAIKEKKQKTKKEIENEPEKGSQLQLKRTALPNKSLWESGTLATPVLDQLSSERVLAPGGHTCRRPPEAPLYKTGDLARWLPDGNIEFLGRIDHQVKIRGMRVELGEIERGLLTHPEIKEAVVLARELKKGDTVLCTYYVVKSIPPPETALKDYLSHTLPAYMIPTHFIRQEKIPLTPTEKIDRKALAQIHIPKLKSQAYSAPRTETEKKMVEIWADILEYPRDKLGIDDDFFQIRGHSLNATTMTARIHKTFNINIPLAVIFKTTTIRGLAGNIKGLTEDTYLSVKPAEKKEYYILSAPQKRVYILQQMELESTAYNMPVTLPLGGNTGLVELENMFRKLIRRHDSLRTSFGMIKETPVQLIHDTVEFKITHYKRNQTFFRPFDLAQAPLIRVGVRQEEGGAILLLDMHHIITDGISLEILTGELAGLYRNENLTLLKRQYKDYAEWQNNIKQKELMSRQEAIWLKRFSGELPVLELPTDYPRPVNLDFEGSTIPFAITKEETAELKGKAKENESTLYMVILSIFSIMLSKLGGQEDIVIGTATAGRRHADLENIVGMFVNTLAIRIYVDEEKSVTGFLGDVKRNTLEAFENQEYPFEDLVDRLSKRRDAGRNPIFDVMFNLLNQPPQNEQDKNSSNPFNSLNSLNSFNSLNSPNPLSTSKFDLTLSAFDNTERGDALTFQFQYRTKLFKEGTIKRFITYFKKMIQTVPRDPGQKISELELLTEKERKQILYKFNDTATDYPRDKTIHQLFEEQVEKNPDKITTVGSTQYAVGKGKTVGSRQYAVDNENIKDKTKSKKEIKNNKKIKDNKETIEDKELTAREKTSSIQHQASSIPSTPSTPSIQSIQLTYRELNKNSNHLARHLQSKGVEPGALVAIMVERSVEMLTGILAILKAGAAYLPLSPAYPRERIRYLLADSNVGTVLTTRSFSKELNAAGKIIHFDEAAERAEQEVPAIQAPLPVRYPSTGIAYIIYTSGSTGRPKGTLIEHRSLVNLSLWHGRYYEITADDHSTQYADFSFDASVCEIFPYLIKGATLHIIADEMRLDILELKGYYNKNKITLSFLPTQVCQQFMEDQQETPSLRCLLTAGEKLTHFIPRSYGLYNNYGPTENTVAATTIHVKEQSVNIPIGKPVDNSRVYIMDRQFAHLQPIGVPGELCIGGDSLARGYLNKPELTAERFAKDSWQKEKREQKAKEPEKGSPSKLTRTAPLNKSLWESRTLSSERVLALGEPPAACLYRTGDLARWLPDGNIEFLGRIDQQVKIRGFRIELGEIEKCLSGHREINEAVVIARQMEGNDRVLCAYYVLGSTQENHDFKGFLSRYLPDYMIPSFFVELEKIPLTPNGKVDVKALPAPEIDGDGDYEAPEGRVARTLAAVWRQVLNIGETRRLGVNDNFFNLGGDSIKTIQIAARLRKYDLKLDVKDLFLYQTIKQLVPHIKKISRSILQGAVEGKVPLTPVQQWFFRTFVTDRHHFNQSVLIYREKGFDKSILERVFSKIIQHHDALRMVYEIEKKTGTRSDDIAVIQQNRGVKEQLFHLETIDLKNLTEENVKKRIPIEANRIQGGIDLKNGPLVKLGLFKTSSGHHLLIAVHHLVVDGISWRILLEDIQTCFNQAYQGEKLSLPDKTDSFKYWAEKLTQYAQGTYGQSLFKEKEYWEQVERAEVKPLPVDREIRETGRDKRKVKYRENVDMSLDKTETLNLLKKVNWAYNTEINDILLAALALALKEWNQMEKIRLILEGHGRETIIEDVDINRTVGWFTSRYPVLLDLSHVSEKTRHQLAYTVKSVKETLRRIPNKGVNYGILTYLATNRQTAGLLPTPGDAAEITFNYLGQFGGAGDENAPQYFGMSPIGGGENHSPEMEQVSLIDINGMVAGDRLNMTVSYNRNQFDHKNITRLTTLFKSKLQEIIRHTMSRKEKEHTPSDLGTHRITIEKLEELTGNVQHTFGKNTKISHIYPLSPMQQGMLFHQIADKKSSAYFEQTLFSIKGELEVQRFKESFGLLTERYEILRTLFLYESLETPLQMVLETEESAENTVRFLYKDISHIKESEIPTFLEKFRQKDKENGFELSRDMPIRIAVLKTGHQSYHIIWSFFHIIMDGWCIGIIFKELLYFYNSLKEEPGAPIQLEPVTPYRTYICWLEKQDNEEGLEFWQNYLEGYEQVSELPKTITTDGKHKLNREYKTAHLDYELDAPKTAHLNTLAQENGTTLNLVVQTIWGMLLMRYNNSRDVVFGAVVSGRPAGLEGIESMVGLFINTVPVRITAGSQQGGQFLKLLETLHANTTKTNAFEYQSLAEVQARSALKSRLFDHIMIFENYPVAEELEQSTKAHGLPFELYASDTREQTNYSFNIVVVPGKRLKIKFHYNASVYDTQLVENARLHLNQIISQVTENPGILTEDIEIITEKEKQQILYEFNNTAADFPKDKTIYQLFEEQVERTPGSISIVGSGQYAVGNEKIKDKTKSKKEIKDNKKIKNKKQTKDQLLQMGGADYTLQDVIPNVGGIHESPSSTPSGIQYPASGIQHPASSIQSIPSFPSFPSTPSTQSTQSIQLTYRELNNKANRLADLLQSKGVKPGTIVAIMTERNVEMITALLGILKAGGAYLPIDTGYPEARVNYMLADSNTKIVLKGVNKAGEQDQEPSHKKGIEIIDLNELSKNEDQEKGDKRQPTPGSRPPLPGFAYIIYTSGTTGKPKGTIVAHPSLVNLCLWYTGYYNFTERDRSTQYASIGFDASVFEIFPTLIKGAALHIIADEHRLDIHRLKKYYTKNNITLSMLPTQFCQTFTEDAMEIPTLRCLMTGGEKLVHFTPRHYALYNNYGPTENTVSTTAYHVTEQKANIPIGKPIANNRVYILDRTSRHLQPIGIPGELCIGGDSLAIGYLNSPELTAERFAKASRQLAVGSWQGKDSKQLAVGSWQKEKIKEQKERAKEPEKGSPSKLTPTAPLNKSLWESGTLSSERVLAPGGHTCRRPPEASTLYHTGDLARWLPDGNIEFLGRMDHQVKIRGYRIELGEIESSLSAHPEIREAAVLARETKDGDMFICAYYSGGDTTSASGFRDFLSRGLPGYMIPAHFVWVERIPLNANGKVDAKKLNSTPINGPSALNGTAYAEPVSENEKAVAAVWREVLNRDKISLHDDFFEIGGDSIKAIRVLSKLQVTFEITLNDIFEYQTLLHLAGKILYKGDTNRVKLKIEELKQRILAEPDINESRRDELTKRREKAFTRYRKQYTADVTRDISPLIPYENILLTGGTGYLGIHLLQALLQNTTARIHVLVRGQNAEEAGERLQRKFHWYFKDTPYQKYKARISVIAGDIAADSFKLPAKQYAKLSQSIDCIINTAAFVKHYGKYDDFHQINVQGVKRLLEFAGSGKGKDFNQISTTGVAGTVKKVNGFVFFSEYETGTDAQKEPNYYIRTKLEAENLVLEAHKKGITANIIRVGNLIFQSRTGIFQENIEDNAFYSQMKSLIKIGLFPEMHAQSLEFSFVDYTAEAVSLLFAAKELKNETYHVRNPHHISYTQMADFIRQARSQRETPLKTVPGDEFLDFIKDNYDHNVYSHYIKPFLLHSHILEEQEDSIITFSSEKTEKLLEKLGFHWPEPNGKHVEKMLQHGKERNFF